MSEIKSETLIAESVLVESTPDTPRRESEVDVITHDEFLVTQSKKEAAVREALRALYKKAQDAGLPGEPNLPQVDPEERKARLADYHKGESARLARERRP